MGHHFRQGWFRAGLAFLAAAYVPKIMAVAELFSTSGVYDEELRKYNKSCATATGGLMLIPALGGILALITGYSCSDTGSNMWEGVYDRGAFGYSSGIAPINAWIAFGFDLLGIVWTTIGLIGQQSVGGDSVGSVQIGDYRLTARSGVSGGGSGVTLRLEL